MTGERDGRGLRATPARPGLQSLDRTIARTLWSMTLERAVAAFWPVWTLGFFAFAVVRLGLLAPLPDEARLAVLALLALALVVALVRGIGRFHLPSRIEAVVRLDRDLPGAPITALSDSQATGRDDPGARAVWAAHMRRVAALAARARAAWPDLRISARDPYGLRFAAFSLFAAALVFGRSSIGEQVDTALTAPAQASIEQGPLLEAWASPPAYTGKPTLYLTELGGDQVIELPQGSSLMLRLYSGSEEARLEEAVSEGDPAELASPGPGIRQAEFTVERSGTVAVRDGDRLLGQWRFAMIPDTAPRVSMARAPEPTVSGAGKFSYTGQDDYGITAAWATVTLDLDAVDRRYGLKRDPEPRPPIEIDLPLPLTGGARDFTETQVVDLSDHPWAGLPVRLVLHAHDAAEQAAQSEAYAVILPARRFFEPLARAIVEQRRDLLWNVENAPRVMRLLHAITYRPEGVFRSHTAYLMVRTALRRMGYAAEAGRLPAVRDEVAALLWHAALMIEEGDLSSALERLRRAQDRLSKAMREGASDEELAQLMDELRRAMQDYLEELARQALKNMEENPDSAQNQPQPNMSTQDLQQMLDQLRELMQQGRMAEAEQLLQQLRQMMENLQMTMRPGQQPGQGQQMMEGLQNLMREQQELGDRTFQELQRQFGQGEDPGQTPGPGSEELSRRQEALRQLLDEFRRGLPPGPGPGTEQDGQPLDDARRALEDAERNMGDARDSLRRDNPGAAVDDQAEALDNLREGMRSLSEAQRQAQMQNGPNAGTAEELSGQRSDPLGRPLGNDGRIDGGDVKIPGTEAFKRSRELREELLRRSGEQDRPKIELDYLRRLLERF
ncbi:MAG: TIGR02302 family protein [Alphaproteobacteria bacterium]|nr:MAG: TIGR02302 family protein [Alphaproteobacteria bacterium]